MAAIILPGLFLAMLMLAILHPRAALLTALFLASWTGADVDVGLRITAYQLVLAPLIIVMALRLAHPGMPARPLATGGLFIAFLVYAVGNSAFQIAGLPDLTIANSALRGPQARAVIQILLFVFALAPVLLVPMLFSGAQDVQRLGRVWLWSAGVLALIGWAQLAIWYGTGTNPLPIGRINQLLGGAAEYSREGRFSFEGLGIYRMNSLANEPRNLGQVMALAMVTVQAFALTVRQINGPRLALLWLFFMVTAVFTYSTSGVAVWLIGTAALLPALWITGVPLQRSPASLFGALALLIIPIVAGLLVAASAGIPILDLVAERTIERLEESGGVEDFDLAISAWLAANPERLWFGSGLGNAHLFATPFLDPEFAAYAEGQVFSAKTMALRLISELGLVGLVLFAAFALSRILAARGPRLHATAPPFPTAPVLAFAMFAILSATSQIYTEATFMLGALVLLAGLHRAAQPVPPAARPIAA